MNTGKKDKWIVLTAAIGSILNPLNTTMITVALPSIQRDFQMSSTDISWLIASYFIISAIFTPLLGKLSDMYGRKNILFVGFIVVFASTSLAPLSPNLPVLMTLRGIQAIGTSAIFPAAIGVVRRYIQQNQQRVIGTLTVFASTSAAFGPTIGGMLVQFGGWPIIFYVNLPIVVLGFILTLVVIPKDEKSGTASHSLDGLGIVLFSALVSTWMIFLLGLEKGVHVGALLVSLLLTIVFYEYEKRREDPFINVRFFRKHIHVALIYVQYILATVIFFAVLLTFPSFMQHVLKTTSQLAGYVMLSLSLFAMFMTPIATRWMERVGFRIPLSIGVLLGLIGTVLLYTVHDHSSLLWIGCVIAVTGISNGILNIGLQNLLYSFISVSESGIASGLLMTSRFIGNILASSIFGVVFASGMGVGNMNTLAFVLVIVAIILVPGMIYVTASRRKEGVARGER